MPDSPPFPVGGRPPTGQIADWVELMALSRDTAFKRGDLRAAAQREDLDNADLSEANAWAELEKRSRYLGDQWPLKLNGSRLTRRRPAPVDLRLYRFMCAFGLGGVESSDREMFEDIVSFLIAPLVGRAGLRIGHPAREGMSSSFIDRVTHYVESSGLVPWEVKAPPLSTDNDLGLDVVNWYSFPDKRGGDLHFVVQVATGADWSEKLGDIDLEVWKDHLHWGVPPVRVFATPLVVSLPEARWIRVVRKGGLLLDRPRLCTLAARTQVPEDLLVQAGRRSRSLLAA
jgi:hypothetical protein